MLPLPPRSQFPSRSLVPSSFHLCLCCPFPASNRATFPAYLPPSPEHRPTTFHAHLLLSLLLSRLIFYTHLLGSLPHKPAYFFAPSLSSRLSHLLPSSPVVYISIGDGAESGIEGEYRAPSPLFRSLLLPSTPLPSSRSPYIPLFCRAATYRPFCLLFVGEARHLTSARRP